MSEVVDLALERLIRAERLRLDVAAYRSNPPTDAVLALSDMPVTVDLGDADVDYDSDYRVEE